MDRKPDFITWMGAKRGEDPSFLGPRWDRLQLVIAAHDIWDQRDKRVLLRDLQHVLCAKGGRGYETGGETASRADHEPTSVHCSAF